MPVFPAADTTRLAYETTGQGETLICLPGGPMRAAEYLGDLGGLSADRELVLPDLRGTGASQVPSDPASYRCDRLVDDVEALREHLGLERIDLLGHSAGGTLAVLYAARFPQRIRRLVLSNPSPRVVGLEITDADRRELAEQRRGEPWFEPAFAALERMWATDAGEADFEALEPFFHGRWDAAAQAYAAAADTQRNGEAAAAYYGDGALDPIATRAALTGLCAPVLLLTGAFDLGLPPKHATEYASLFPRAELAVQPGAGHTPWLDDPDRFRRLVADFLADA